jgi:hypothetical protein
MSRSKFSAAKHHRDEIVNISTKCLTRFSSSRGSFDVCRGQVVANANYRIETEENIHYTLIEICNLTTFSRLHKAKVAYIFVMLLAKRVFL